jgi:hypothetical protein
MLLAYVDLNRLIDTLNQLRPEIVVKEAALSINGSRREITDEGRFASKLLCLC